MLMLILLGILLAIVYTMILLVRVYGNVLQTFWVLVLHCGLWLILVGALVVQFDQKYSPPNYVYIVLFLIMISIVQMRKRY